MTAPFVIVLVQVRAFASADHEATPSTTQNLAASAAPISKVQSAKFNEILPNALLPFRAPQLNFALCKLNFFIVFSLLFSYAVGARARAMRQGGRGRGPRADGGDLAAMMVRVIAAQ
jgi:hypothetical protein